MSRSGQKVKRTGKDDKNIVNITLANAWLVNDKNSLASNIPLNINKITWTTAMLNAKQYVFELMNNDKINPIKLNKGVKNNNTLWEKGCRHWSQSFSKNLSFNSDGVSTLKKRSP